MSAQITTAMVRQYKDTVMFLASQETSRLRGIFSEETISGEETYFDQIGTIEMKDVTSRGADTEYTDTPHARRRIVPVTSDIADLVDDADRVRVNIAPEGAYTRRHAEAWGRRIDDHIIDAAFANASTGKDGTGTETWSSAGNIIAVGYGSSNGLTLAKVAEAQRILDEGEVPREGRVAVIGAAQVRNLMGIATATSADYVALRPLMDGEITQWLGFTFIQSQRLSKSGNNRSCIFAHRDGIKLGVAQDMFARVEELPTKRYSTQVFLRGVAGATRMEASRVVEVLADETVA